MIDFGDQIKETIIALARAADEELYAKGQDELEDYWYFQWDDNMSVDWNTYQFFKNLEPYSNIARRWETHHNGSCCVVERVMDTYTMPKIREFTKLLGEKINGTDETTN